MKPMRRGELEKSISSATVTFSDTGETIVLEVMPGAVCHFFKQFPIGDDDIRLRLDWSDLDNNGHPTLDADFIRKATGKHRSLRGKRKNAHHTPSTPGKGRYYEWFFNGFGRSFSVTVAWLAVVSACVRIGDSPSAEVISSGDHELENG